MLKRKRHATSESERKHHAGQTGVGWWGVSSTRHARLDGGRAEGSVETQRWRWLSLSRVSTPQPSARKPVLSRLAEALS